MAFGLEITWFALLRPQKALKGIGIAIGPLSMPRNLHMLRSLLIILTVAAIAGWISTGERAIGNSAAGVGNWIRTADGWEPRYVVESQDEDPSFAIHPAVVAILQVGVSLFFLLACPSRVRTLVAEGTAFFKERRQGRDRRVGGDRRQSLAT